MQKFNLYFEIHKHNGTFFYDATFPYVLALCQSNLCSSSSLIAIQWRRHGPHPYVQCYDNANPRDSKPYRGEGQTPGPGVTRPCPLSVTREKLAPCL